MKLNVTILFVLLTSSLLWFGCAKETVDPEFYGSIEGRVQTSSGEGLSSVSITTTPGTDAILTDANGQFTISDIPTGNYTIQAQKDSFITKTVRIAVKEDRVATATIVLEADDSEGSSNGNISAQVDFVDQINYQNIAGADSNIVDVEYMIRNVSSSKRIGNYEVYFDIFTSNSAGAGGPKFNFEVKGDSLRTLERTYGSFQKYIREFQVDSVRVSGFKTPNT